jgi:hypothetical protein
MANSFNEEELAALNVSDTSTINVSSAAASDPAQNSGSSDQNRSNTVTQSQDLSPDNEELLDHAVVRLYHAAVRSPHNPAGADAVPATHNQEPSCGNTPTLNLDQAMDGGLDITALPSPVSAALTEFKLFPNLPKEIQMRIWKYTLPGPRVVLVQRHHNKYTQKYRGCRSPTKSPVALFVCP